MSQGQNSPGQSGTVYMILIIILMVGFMGLMNYRYDLIAGIWQFIRSIEICALSWMPNWVPIYGDLELGKACNFLNNIDADTLAPETVQEFDRRYSKFFSWAPALILIAIGVTRLKTTGVIGEKFKAESMLLFYEKWFPNILSGVVKDNPLNHPLEYDRDLSETGKYGKSMSGENWAVLSPPMGLEAEAKEDSSINRPIWDGASDFDEDLCERAFIKQLGEKYEGRQNLNETQKRIVSIVHAKVPTSERDRLVYLKEALDELLDELENGTDNTANEVLYPTFPLIKKHIVDCIKQGQKSKTEMSKDVLIERLKKISSEKRLFKALDKKSDKKPTAFMLTCQMLKIERRLAMHGFVNTGMMSLLVEARDAGRVDSFANFNWVKEKDRTLWYCLDTVGRNVSFVECAGVFAHWEIEKVVGKAITHPEVTTAVEAMKKYLTVLD
ncbi:MAG: hypothetical protein RSG77_09900 [Hafnia sp.]